MELLISIIVGALVFLAGYATSNYVRSDPKVPRDEDGRIKAPPAPPLDYKVGKIAELERELEELRRTRRDEVEISGLTDDQVYEVSRFDPKAPHPYRAGVIGYAFPICYVRDESKAKQWATEPACTVRIVNVWGLPDGRIAYRDKRGYRPTLTLIKPELVK